jgi:T5SS/PEP-CTERM-associated repeat protein
MKDLSMKFPLPNRLVRCAVVLLGSMTVFVPTPARGQVGNWSFTGTIDAAGGRQEFIFDLLTDVPSSKTLRFETHSTEGGTNAAGVAIPSGGFDTYLDLAKSGNVVARDFDIDDVFNFDARIDFNSELFLSNEIELPDPVPAGTDYYARLGAEGNNSTGFYAMDIVADTNSFRLRRIIPVGSATLQTVSFGGVSQSTARWHHDDPLFNLTIEDRLIVNSGGTGRASLINGGRLVVNGPTELRNEGFLTNRGGTFDAAGGLTLSGTGNLELDGGVVFIRTGGLDLRNAGVFEHYDGVLVLQNGAFRPKVTAGVPYTINGQSADDRPMLNLGTGASWEISNTLLVGVDRQAEINVVSNATLTTELVALGENAGSQGQIDVTSADATWTANNDVFIGSRGSGTMNVWNGGWATHNARAYVGAVGSGNGFVQVRDPGSFWGVEDHLTVGGSPFGTGGTGLVQVRFGGLLRSISGSSVGKGTATSGRVELFGNQTGWFSVGLLSIGNVGSVDVGGGAELVTAGDVEVLDAGTLSIGTDSLVKIDGDLRLARPGSLALVGGSLTVDQVLASPFTIVTFAGGRLRTSRVEGNLFQTTSAGSSTLDVGYSPLLLTGGVGDTVVTGAYFTGSAGSASQTLEFELGGDTPGVTHDRLIVGGSMTFYELGLDVHLINGFSPVAGDTFDLLDWGSLDPTSTLGELTLPSLPEGLGWDTDDLLVDGTLSVVRTSPPGDYDFDGVVTPSDYIVWQSLYGSLLNFEADGNGDGKTDAADYTIWRDNLGASLPSFAGTTATPEPTAGLLALVAIGLGWRSRR